MVFTGSEDKIVVQVVRVDVQIEVNVLVCITPLAEDDVTMVVSPVTTLLFVDCCDEVSEDGELEDLPVLDGAADGCVDEAERLETLAWGETNGAGYVLGTSVDTVELPPVDVEELGSATDVVMADDDVALTDEGASVMVT